MYNPHVFLSENLRKQNFKENNLESFFGTTPPAPYPDLWPIPTIYFIVKADHGNDEEVQYGEGHCVQHLPG